ncbi:MAG: transcriptional repressor [Verrucomicrobia bacterium]|nr:transcriptional repressor [Verrucomicrobiota bacterium]NBU09506.1 transcriptional repressor [Pseudomonadota bacterium]NDA66397.1 transcriptional repressor [Verrucomicrobiota bacterium]NDB75913.1 transcriptional repressor [Verrucomicrobiota bacterium]NDD38016.1 transcriptional repressor [Verrucomicrobiota bacterium]
MRTASPKAPSESSLDTHLANSGLRVTPQRQRVHEVLREKMDHPTADQVFLRAKNKMPEISMATVYNCLDALVQCGLVRQVTLDRGATRYCPNMQDHSHFYCDACGSVYDILQTISPEEADIKLPRGFRLKNIETNLHGLCPDCAAKAK